MSKRMESVNRALVGELAAAYEAKDGPRLLRACRALGDRTIYSNNDYWDTYYDSQSEVSRVLYERVPEEGVLAFLGEVETGRFLHDIAIHEGFEPLAETIPIERLPRLWVRRYRPCSRLRRGHAGTIRGASTGPPRGRRSP